MNKQQGYVLDTPYPAFFYPDMQPLWLNSIVEFLGFESPALADTFSYLELACASGTNLLVCAQHYPQAQFVGIDFNLEHIQQAKASASALGLQNVEFIHCDFAAFVLHNQQQFDFIVQHGTFSWIAPAQQQQVLKIVANALKDGGVFYLHYMCYPGSNALQPIQKLFHLVDRQHQNSLAAVSQAKQLFSALHSAGAFIDQPKIGPIAEAFAQAEPAVAHEFLTEHWQPLYSVDVHQQVFEEAGLHYVGSANPFDNLDHLSVPTALQPIIQETTDPALKEYLKDIARDAKQRTDVFLKRPQALHPTQHNDCIMQMQFQLLPQAPRSGAVKFDTSIGTIQAPAEVISPLLEQLAQQNLRFADLLQLQAFKTRPIFLIETLFLLMQARYVHPVTQHARLDGTAEQRFNQHMQQQGLQLRLVPACATAMVSSSISQD